MDLFVVNRFTGEETSNVNKEEENKLSEVLNKINKRKKRKLKAKKDESIEGVPPDDSKLFKLSETTQADTDGFLERISGDDSASEEVEPRLKNPNRTPASIDGYTIIGTDKFDKKLTVKRVLPTWLRSPTLISTDLQKLTEKISHTDLDKKLISLLKENEIKYMFPVQAGFIPWQLKKSKQLDMIHPPDACVSAPTGSGKTLAFAIPIIQYLLDKLKNRNMTVKAVRALLVLPTQSLAKQIYNAFKSFTKGTDIIVGILTSGYGTFKLEQKLLVTNNTVWGSSSRFDIVICTAGRLIDHLKSTKGFNLQYLEYVIIDEADRVLDSMQDDWLHYLGMHLRSHDGNFVGTNVLRLSTVNKRIDPQKLLFSATLSSDPEKLVKLSLFQPKLFTCVTDETQIESENMDKMIGKYTVPQELEEKYTTCSLSNKPLVLYKIITNFLKTNEASKIMVFVNETDTGHRLSSLLCFMAKKAFIVKEISDKTQQTMSRDIIQSFSNGQTNVLICTNLIARGIDIPNVDCVVSYSAPTHIKTYVHRAGRTARGGMKGVCITILEDHEERKFLNMLHGARPNIKSLEKLDYNEGLESLSSLYKKSLDQLKFKVQKQKRNTLFKTKIRKRVSKNYRKQDKI